MKPLINTQQRLASVLELYKHLLPDLPIHVFEQRCRQIHIAMLKYLNAHAPKDPV